MLKMRSVRGNLKKTNEDDYPTFWWAAKAASAGVAEFCVGVLRVG